MRSFTLALLAFLLGQPLLAQYTVRLESGDTLSIPSYYIKGDSLGFPAGRVASKEIVYMTIREEVYIFKIPSGAMRRVHIENPHKPCSQGKIHAERLEEAGIEAQRALGVRLGQLGDPDYALCFKGRLAEQGINIDQTSPSVVVGERDPEPNYPTNMVVLRTGDTLEVGRSFYMTGDSLDWSDDTKRIHKDDVLVLLTKEGQKIIPYKRSVILPLKTQVKQLSPCSFGLIYAHIYQGSDIPWRSIPGIGTMGNNTEALACYANEDERLRKLYPIRSKGGNDDHPWPRSFLSVGAGVGPNFGLIGAKSVIGPKGTGLLLGAGRLGGSTCYQAGVQVAIKAWFINLGYGTYEVGSYQIGFSPAREYTLEGFTVSTGGMVNLTSNKRLFLEGSLGYLIDGARPIFLDDPVLLGFTFNFGVGYRLGKY